MKYGVIKGNRAFLYEENGMDVVDEVFLGWGVMWEGDEDFREDLAESLAAVGSVFGKGKENICFR